MSRHWDIENFMRTYQKYECLWNVKSPNYRNIALKLAAYDEIALKFYIDVAEVKKKINSYRTTYMAEKKKIRDSARTGASTDDLYISHIPWLSACTFLDAVVEARTSKSNTTSEALVCFALILIHLV